MLHQQHAAIQAAQSFQLPVTRKSLTWERMTQVEPRLVSLVARARRNRPRRRDFWRTYESYKRELKTLAGWHAGHRALRSIDAFDIATERLLAALEGRK